MRAALIAVARRAAVSASRRAAPPSANLLARAFLARPPHDFSGVRFMSDNEEKFHNNEEVVEAVNEREGPGPFAVDAPDGEHDLEELEEHKKAVEEIIDYAASHEDPNQINAEHAAGATKAFAVDAPDGEHDLEDVEEHGEQVKAFVDDAASLEDAAEIKRQQELRDATRVEAEKHPEKDL